MPHRSANSVWYGAQTALELARRAGARKIGIVTDIIKAFNCVPREPVFATAILFGLPRKLVVAWQGALTRLVRRFRIRGSLGPGISSSNGFPEGDGLSCTAIALVGLCFHRFSASRFPRVVTCSYVDNLSGTGTHWQDILEAKEVYDELAQAWDLELDKTVIWSTCPLSRRELRKKGHQVVLDGPDLGGHMQYPLRYTKFTVVARISSLEQSWMRLRHSTAPYIQKLHAVRAAAWPAGLHACSLVGLGPRHFEQLRAAASKAIGMSGPGMNLRILLSWVENPLSDPEYHALW